MMKKTMGTFILTLVLVSLLISPVLATNGMQFIGVGAYQKGMGGAITAAPYTTATAITNPAGMALIGMRTDFSTELFVPNRYADFPDMGPLKGGKDEGGSEFYMAPAIGWNAPAWFNKDICFGGGMYGVAGMGVDYGELQTPTIGYGMDQQLGQIATSMGQPDPTGDNNPQNATGNIWSNYQFWKLAPSAAYKVNDKLAIGGALNVDYQALSFESYYTGDFMTDINTMTGKNLKHFGFDLSETQAAFGAGFTLGTIYQYNDALTLGASYTSKQHFTDYEYRLDEGDVLTQQGNEMYYNEAGVYKMNMDAPRQVALGMAYRPNQKWLVSTDVKWINYSDTMDNLYLEGDFKNLMTGTSKDRIAMPWGWDDIVTYSIGIQYKYSPKLNLRAGYNHGDSPVESDDVFNNLPAIAIVEDHLSVGATYKLDENWELTATYMHAFENELTDSMYNVKSSLEEDSFDGTISYKF